MLNFFWIILSIYIDLRITFDVFKKILILNFFYKKSSFDQLIFLALLAFLMTFLKILFLIERSEIQ